MRSKSESSNQLEPDPHAIPPALVYSEPWWRDVGYNTISPVVAGENASNSTSFDDPNGSKSNDCQSMSNDEVNDEEEDAKKESQTTASSRPGGNCGQEQQHLQCGGSAIPTMGDECFTQPPQLELVGHSIACASNPYQDPYYGGIMAAYGHQPMGYPQFVGMSYARMPLPLEMAQEPVYVNAKQYQGILRRRQARAKAELEKKLIKVRKPYLHESWHKHAMRRARGSGGRFAKKTAKDTGEEKGRGQSSQSGSSSGSEPLPSDSAETSTSRQQDAHEAQTNVNESGYYQNGSTLFGPVGDRGEDGDCSGQQWGSMSSNQASRRPLAIQ